MNVHRPRRIRRSGSAGVWLAFLLAPLLASASCATVRNVTSAPEDYDAYRTIRLQESFVPRLAAAWVYLRQQPEGAYRPEVERWFRAADERFLVRHWDDMSNLERYVDALPDAPRVGMVEARLDHLRALRKMVHDEDAAFMAAEKARQEALDVAKQSRGEFVRSLTTWVQGLGTSTEFGKPLTEWDPAVVAVLNEAPALACQGQVCTKSLLLGFEVAQTAGLEVRAVEFSLQYHFEKGRLTTAVLSGDRLFDRLAEGATAKAVDASNLQARAEALGVATQLLSMALSVGFAEPACEREAIAPVLVARECGGRAAYVIAAESDAEQDRVVVVQR